MSRRDRRADARSPDKASSSSDAATAAALCEIGRQHMQAGRPLDAQRLCQQALAIDPNHVETLHLMGLLALQARQFDHAIEWIGRASRLDVKTDYLGSLGIALGQQGLHEEAFKAIDLAVQFRPDDTELWIDHGNALMKLERPTEALKSYQGALKLNPRHGDAVYRCGSVLLNLGRLDEALTYFNFCDELHPNNAGVLERRGLVLLKLKRLQESLADNMRAHALNPANPDTCNNIGAALQLLCRDAEALPWFDKAIALKPDPVTNLVTVWVNKAFTLTQLQRFDEAIAAFEQAKTIAPNSADVRFHLSLLHLLTGNFEAGWVGREARRQASVRPGDYPDFSQPMWLGEGDVAGKTILVLEDEGFGDTIQYARYIPMLAARGARVILRVGDAAYRLLSGLSGVAECVPKSAPSSPAFDLHCPLCSLPLAFGTRLDTIPSEIAYLPAPAESRLRSCEQRLQGHIGPRKGLRVGLAWSGRPTHPNDHNRSIPLSMLSAILDADASFVSLQKDLRPSDEAVLRQTGIIDLTPHLTDFAETAALINCLDLVITVDTSVAHLAGALGRPVWTLLPFTPDYRWLLDREDSPWYPTMRLFRQSAKRDWGEVVHRVRIALVERIASLARQ